MTKTFVRFFTIADFKEEEAWLREQHKAGWKLVKLTAPVCFKFEKVEPEDVIYRLDYKNKAMTAEYKQMYEDFGWEYAGHCVGWNYFRKPAAEAATEEDGELFSDHATKADMLTHVFRTRMLPLLVILLCCIIPGLNRFIDEGLTDSWAIGMLIFYAVMFVFYIYLLLHCGIKLKKMKDECVVEK